MTTYKVRTNNQARDLISFHDLTTKEQADFDYIEGEDQYSLRLVRYKGCVYDTSEFSRLGETQMATHEAPDVFAPWDGYQGDSFFSGVVLRWAKDDAGRPDFERVVMGTYYG